MNYVEDVKLAIPRRKCGWFPNGRFGLKGGAPPGGANSRKPKQQSSLRLINNKSNATRNICFTNSVIQLMRNSGYASILKSDFPQFIVGKPDASFKECKAISQLYCDQSNRERSAAQVRKLVANQTGKLSLCDGNQQDSDEFLRSVISMMSIELNNWDVFSNMHSQHMGMEKIKRKFLDNSSGVCSKYGEFPSSRDQEFSTLSACTRSRF